MFIYVCNPSNFFYLNVNASLHILFPLYYTCKHYGIPYRTRYIYTLSVLQVGLRMAVSTAETCRHALIKIYLILLNNFCCVIDVNTRVGTLIVATIYLQLIQNRYMFRSFTVLQALVTST